MPCFFLALAAWINHFTARNCCRFTGRGIGTWGRKVQHHQCSAKTNPV